VPDPAFVLVVRYTAPLEEIEALMDAHRAWLDRHYAAGTFLASGPQVPRVGGVILARGESAAAIRDLVGTDPFLRAGAADYDVIEFAPNRGPLTPALTSGVSAG
jgi:uncharacterized protein YciI